MFNCLSIERIEINNILAKNDHYKRDFDQVKSIVYISEFIIDWY